MSQSRRHKWQICMCVLWTVQSLAQEILQFRDAKPDVEVLAGTETLCVLRPDVGPFPFFHPVRAPGGRIVTRPVLGLDAPDHAKYDHPHHRGLWFTHGDVNGCDFWSLGHGIIRQEGPAETDAQRRALCTTNVWLAEDRPCLRDIREWLVWDLTRDHYILEFRVTLQALDSPVTFGDTKEGSLAIRLTDDLRADPPGRGRIQTADGHTGRDAWGKLSRWCLYSTDDIGVLIMDHPRNPRTSAWHVRTYGLFAANPFGRKSFGLATEPQPFQLPSRSSTTFVWAICIVRGQVDARCADELWRRWATDSVSRAGK